MTQPTKQRLGEFAFRLELSSLDRDARLSELTDDEIASIVAGVVAAAGMGESKAANSDAAIGKLLWIEYQAKSAMDLAQRMEGDQETVGILHNIASDIAINAQMAIERLTPTTPEIDHAL